MKIALPISAHDTLAMFWDNTIPVNPISIANKMNVKVFSSSTLDVDGEFNYNAGQPEITIKETANKQRNRFTIAHELAHFCLNHGNRKRDPKESFNIHNYDPIERDANRFAAQILMPDQAVKSAIRISGMTDVDTLSKYFDVSTVAMRIRLKELSIL